MSDKTWKAVERAIAKFFPNGKRRGADFRSEDSGKTDIISDGWAIEVKHSKRPTYGLMVEAFDQAARNRKNPNDIPIAVIHKAGEPYERSLVIMTLDCFQEFFINQE